MFGRLVLGLCCVLVQLALTSSSHATSRIGEFSQPKTVGEFTRADRNVEFYRFLVLSSRYQGEKSGICQFLQVALATEKVRGNSSGEIYICSDLPQTAGTEYFSALFPWDALAGDIRDKIQNTVPTEFQVDLNQLFLQKPLWRYRVYSIDQSKGNTIDYIVLPKTHVLVPERCIDKTERRISEYDNGDERSEYRMQHVVWQCFLEQMRNVIE